MKKLTLSLATALLAAGCAAPTPVATTGRHLYNFTTQISFDAATARRVMSADNVTKVTGGAVDHIDVYLAAGQKNLLGLGADDLGDTAVWSKATINQITYDAGTGMATGASVTFGNLAYNQAYTIVSVAKGHDPNSAAPASMDVLNDANLYLSAAELDVPDAVNGVYQQNMDPTEFEVLHAFDADGDVQSASVTALPAKLKNMSFAGHADGVTVNIQDGVVQSADGPATVVDATPKLVFKDTTRKVTIRDGMGDVGVWIDNPLSFMNTHFQLTLPALPAGTEIKRILLTSNVANDPSNVADTNYSVFGDGSVTPAGGGNPLGVFNGTVDTQHLMNPTRAQHSLGVVAGTVVLELFACDGENGAGLWENATHADVQVILGNGKTLTAGVDYTP